MNITIIGAGLACYNLVQMLRRRKFTGTIVVISQCDGAQYYKPKLSTGFSDAMTPQDHITAQPEAWAAKLNVTLITNTQVNQINSAEKRLLTTSGEYAYDKLVLAYGAQPRTLTGMAELLTNDQAVQVHNVNSLASYQSFFQQTTEQHPQPVIIGAGLVGCELASDLANSGYQPTVISSGPYPFHPLFPQQFSEYLKDKLVAAGVTFIDQQKVTHVAAAQQGVDLTLSSGAINQAKVAINCAGLVVDTALAATGGIQTDIGIVTDATLQTSVADIYAIGDCAQINGQMHQYIAPILICARALAATLMGQTSSVNLTFYPIEVKIQQSATRFMIKATPQSWTTERTEQGMIAKGYKDGKLSGFALTGDALAQVNELVVELMTP